MKCCLLSREYPDEFFGASVAIPPVRPRYLLSPAISSTSRRDPTRSIEYLMIVASGRISFARLNLQTHLFVATMSI